MKKLTGCILILVLLFTAYAALADAPIDETNFPDPAFREIVQEYDKNRDGTLSDREAGAVRKLDLSAKRIRDLTGIQLFARLQVLNVQDNIISSLDVSSCAELTELICKNNPLLDLNVSGCKKLKHLDSESTYMTELDLSGNPELNDLCVTDMASLTILSLSSNPKMDKLWTLGSGLTAVNISACPQLVKVYAADRSDFGDGYMYADKNWKHVLVVNGNATVSITPELVKVHAESLDAFRGTWELDFMTLEGVTYSKTQLNAGKTNIIATVTKDRMTLKSSSDSATATIELIESDGSLKTVSGDNSIDYFFLLEDGHLYACISNTDLYFSKKK